MHVVVVGCGRVGSELAGLLEKQGHTVAVIDKRKTAFRRLATGFSGYRIVGFGFETVGDRQLARHRADPARRGRVLDTGLWHYTRHPNYFGDAMVWWGLWLIAAAAGGAWTVFAPALMTLFLMRVSGVALLEKQLLETRPGYRDYVARTNAFFPWVPRA